MSGHLTGWRVSAGDERTVFDGSGSKLVSVPCGGLSGRTFDEAADAAHLIASAPALLAALEKAARSIEAMASALRSEQLFAAGNRAAGWAEDARASIAKARGTA